jgi:hypothetical protein
MRWPWRWRHKEAYVKVRMIIPEPATVHCFNCEKNVDKIARFQGPKVWDTYTSYMPRITHIDLCQECLNQGLSALGPVNDT